MKIKFIITNSKIIISKMNKIKAELSKWVLVILTKLLNKIT